ncbi:VPLPA-CTERM sorting domain-containing protein [uncultured Roseobacter sp.]|uniref:VPLPA-CTERM sorting domain-containing protein n=1 Tax=uncultured Roseobacter sp. TaxID=114847 RepID=UPI002628D099|nr:VPLPA-CTERM sorting domain-containing protein [uncultured Roseobacter sp.]
MGLRKTACAALVYAVWTGALSAAPVHAYFDLVGHQGLQAAGDSLEFESGDLTLSATGHLLNDDGSIGDIRRIGQYGYETAWDWSSHSWTVQGGGLGVTTGHRDSHQVDSRKGDEVIKLSFNKTVTIERLYFSLVDWDDDFAFSVVDGEDAGAFYPHVDIVGEGYGYYDFHQDWTGTMFGIGAANSTCHKRGKTYSCDNWDNFKLKGVKVSYDDISPVPLPAAGWMLIAAIGGMGLMRRRK